MDANFNIAILDGHKNFVAHEKFQQMLHKKWGQRDKLMQSTDTVSYNIFWSEMSSPAKFWHGIKQIPVFLLLPFFFVITSILGPEMLKKCQPCAWLLTQSQIPVNRFLYWEMSKVIFYFIVLMTLIQDQDLSIYELLASFWIISYLLENFRTIHRLYRYV